MLQPCCLFHERPGVCPALDLLRVRVAGRMRCLAGNSPHALRIARSVFPLRCPALRARQAVPLLIELMKDAVPQVKDTAAWCMCRICELHTPSIQDDNKMQVVMNVLVLGLADHAKVARWCVGALNVLTEHYAEDAEARCYTLPACLPACMEARCCTLGTSAAVHHCARKLPSANDCLPATRRGAVRCGAV